jgi:hypothetical protein
MNVCCAKDLGHQRAFFLGRQILLLCWFITGLGVSIRKSANKRIDRGENYGTSTPPISGRLSVLQNQKETLLKHENARAKLSDMRSTSLENFQNHQLSKR